MAKVCYVPTWNAQRSDKIGSRHTDLSQLDPKWVGSIGPYRGCEVIECAPWRPLLVHRFTRSYIVESALTPAGDAKELSAILAGKHCLKLSQEWGWLGEINNGQRNWRFTWHSCWQRGQQIHPARE